MPRVSALFFLTVLAGAARADGPIDENRRVADFSGVQVGSGIRATVETGTPATVVLHGTAAALTHVQTEVKDGVLIVRRAPDHPGMERGAISVSVRMPKADSLGVSGGSSMQADVPAAETLDLSASGGGELVLAAKVRPKTLALHASGGSHVSATGIDGARAAIQLSGAATVELAGKIAEAAVQLSGGSRLDAAGLTVTSLAIAGSGGSEAAIRAGAVTGSLSSGSRVRVPSSAQVQVQASHGSAIVQDL